ncbi:unnamed protein product [Closterium sp. NIES-54]
MEVARTSMIHADAPHFLWPFVVRYAEHQFNLWLCVSEPDTSPTLRWTGEVGDASAFRLYHPTTRRVLSSQDVTFEESVCYYHLFPMRLLLSPCHPSSWFQSPSPLPPIAVDSGALGGGDSGGAGSGGVGTGGADAGGAGTGGSGAGGAGARGTGGGGGQRQQLRLRGAEPGGASFGGADTGGIGPGGADAGAGDVGAGDAGGSGDGGNGAGGARGSSPRERREPASRPTLPVLTVRTVCRARHVRPPPVPGTHTMALCPFYVPQRVALPSPPDSSLPDVPDPESDLARAASPTVTRVWPHLSLTLPLIYCHPCIGGELSLGSDFLEGRHFELECLAAATTMDAEMASWKSTSTYIDEVPPPVANIADGMWIFIVKRPPGSPPTFKARYVARGFSQRQGVEFFQTFSPTPKMTTHRVLLHVAAQRDYELHSLDFSTAFLQGSLHEEIWLRRPPGFTGSFPDGTQGVSGGQPTVSTRHPASGTTH